MDSGLHSLVTIARFHQLPAEVDQLAHQFGLPGQSFTDTELLLAAKALTLKAKHLSVDITSLSDAMLPAIAKDNNGEYFIIARVTTSETLSACDPSSSHSSGAKANASFLIQDPTEQGPRTLSTDELLMRCLLYTSPSPRDRG